MSGAVHTAASAAPASIPPAAGTTDPTRRDLALRWYLPLLAGLLPVLLIGFAASALANRLVFAAWALVVAAAYTAVLRFTWGLGRPGRFVAGSALFTLALGFAAFAVLVEHHREILDLGFRAVLPGPYHPVLTRPAAPLALAALLAVAALVCLLACLLMPGRPGVVQEGAEHENVEHGGGA